MEANLLPQHLSDSRDSTRYTVVNQHGNGEMIKSFEEVFLIEDGDSWVFDILACCTRRACSLTISYYCCSVLCFACVLEVLSMCSVETEHTDPFETALES